MGLPAPSELDTLISTLVKRAPELIAAGVTSISLGELSATLERPPPAPPQQIEKRPAPRDHVDPMRDPSTYVGGKVPGFTRDEDRDKIARAAQQHDLAGPLGGARRG